MKFSLVVATINRTNELEELLSSLEQQDYKDFEVIVVDQNPDNRLVQIVGRFKHLSIQHIKTPPKGASNARNVGVLQAKGETLGFPDDDCRYYPDTLTNVLMFMTEADLVTGRCRDDNHGNTVATFVSEKTHVSARNVWHTGVEATIFIKKNTFETLKGFDESLGVGSPSGFGAGEGTDLLLRFIDQGGKAIYFPDLVVYHPDVLQVFDDKAFRRAYSYGRGIGRVLKQNKFPFDCKVSTLSRPMLGTVVYGLTLNWKKAKYQLLSFRGRLEGYLS